MRWGRALRDEPDHGSQVMCQGMAGALPDSTSGAVLPVCPAGALPVRSDACVTQTTWRFVLAAGVQGMLSVGRDACVTQEPRLSVCASRCPPNLASTQVCLSSSLNCLLQGIWSLLAGVWSCWNNLSTSTRSVTVCVCLYVCGHWWAKKALHVGPRQAVPGGRLCWGVLCLLAGTCVSLGTSVFPVWCNPTVCMLWHPSHTQHCPTLGCDLV
jgi:hypothetical protein